MLKFCEIVFKIYFVLSNSIDFVFLQSLNETYCPDDKYWDYMTNDCKACGSGFYGFNCSKPCRHPNYGLQCQHNCGCSETFCNNKFGCPEYYSKVVTKSTNHDDVNEHSTSDKTIVIIATLISGFFVVIVSIIVVTMLLKRHFSRRILTTEKNIDSFVVECIMSGNTSTSRERANNVRRGRYDILHLNI
uniref:Uncharacterized protein n=1 Tax=Magallana gigas TaxID=29159 RepID=A0A8W8MJU0_MAGGI|nr:uncharacterized protein LOC109619023 [Crassostrea gigas]